MKEYLELPVGARIKVMVEEKLITAQVVEDCLCTECVLDGYRDLCGVFECRASLRMDNLGVALKRVEGGEE